MVSLRSPHIRPTSVAVHPSHARPPRRCPRPASCCAPPRPPSTRTPPAHPTRLPHGEPLRTLGGPTDRDASILVQNKFMTLDCIRPRGVFRCFRSFGPLDPSRRQPPSDAPQADKGGDPGGPETTTRRKRGPWISFRGLTRRRGLHQSGAGGGVSVAPGRPFDEGGPHLSLHSRWRHNPYAPDTEGAPPTTPHSVQTHTHTHTRAHLHMYTYTRIHAHTRTHTCTYTHVHARAYIHTHIRIHTHIYNS